MLGKVAIDGLGLTDVDLDPCPYEIFTSINGLEKSRRLIEQEIMIEGNTNKPINYTTM
jgi:hypothetical protein